MGIDKLLTSFAANLCPMYMLAATTVQGNVFVVIPNLYA